MASFQISRAAVLTRNPGPGDPGCYNQATTYPYWLLPASCCHAGLGYNWYDTGLACHHRQRCPHRRHTQVARQDARGHVVEIALAHARVVSPILQTHVQWVDSVITWVVEQDPLNHIPFREGLVHDCVSETFWQAIPPFLQRLQSPRGFSTFCNIIMPTVGSHCFFLDKRTWQTFIWILASPATSILFWQDTPAKATRDRKWETKYIMLIFYVLACLHILLTGVFTNVWKCWNPFPKNEIIQIGEWEFGDYLYLEIHMF